MSKYPTAKEITNARLAAGLTTKQAGALVFASATAWENWEAGRPMPQAFWITFKYALNHKVVDSIISSVPDELTVQVTDTQVLLGLGGLQVPIPLQAFDAPIKWADLSARYLKPALLALVASAYERKDNS